MFVALEAAESRAQGIFGGILNIITKPKARIETREALSAVYGVIIAPKPSRESDWRKITSLAGRYADTMLLPKGIEAPPPVCEARFPKFERRVILKTAIEIIKRTRMPMYRRIAGLVDLDGSYAGFLFPLLHHYTAVKVLTGNMPLYLSQSEQMMQELGAPVMIVEDYAGFSDCVLIIAPDGITTGERLSCPVLSHLPPQTEQYSDFITDLRISAASEVIRLCPDGIEPHKFIAALYEYCGVEAVPDIAEHMNYKYSGANLTQVVHAVMRSSGTDNLR